MNLKLRLSLLLVLLLSVVLGACGDFTATPVPAATPTATPAPASGPEPPLAMKWEYRPAKQNHFIRPLQLSPDGRYDYLLEMDADKGAEVVALNLSSGQVQWRFDVSFLVSDLATSLQLFTQADADTFYFTAFQSQGGLVTALDASSGAKKWEFKVDPSLTFFGGPFFVQENTVFAAFESPFKIEVSLDTERTTDLVALDKKSGAKTWEFKTTNADEIRRLGASITGTGLDATPQLLYLKGVDNNTYAIEPATGKVRWKLEREKNFSISPLKGYQDGLLVVTKDFIDPSKWALRAVSAKDGSTLWESAQTVTGEEIPAAGYFLSGENTFYLLSSASSLKGGTVYSFDLVKGTFKWSGHDSRISQPPGSRTTPYTAASENRVYGAGLIENGLVALDAQSGKVSWAKTDVKYYGLAPTKNTLYTATDKRIMALDAASGNEKWSAELPSGSHPSYVMQSSGNVVLLNLTQGVLAYGHS